MKEVLAKKDLNYLAGSKVADIEEDIKSEIKLTRSKGKWIAWYRGGKIATDSDLSKIQNKIAKFVGDMVKDLSDW